MQRRRWHRRVAEALETGDQASLDAVASRMAAHYEQANLPLRALPHYERAASVALRLFAYEEAAVLLRRLIAIVDRDPDPRRRAERELQAHLRLAAAIRVHRGWASPELEPVHARLVTLSNEVGTPEQRAAALATSLFFHEVLGNIHYVGTALDEMAATLDQTDSPSLRVMGAVARLGHHALRGEFVQSEAIFNRSSALYDRSQHASHVGLTGADFGVLELAWSSHGLWALGRADEAEARVQQALTLARTLMHPFSEALALAYSAMLDQMEGNCDRAALRAADARAVAERHRVVYYEAWANILLAWDAARRQPSAATVSSLRAAIDGFLATGARARLPYYLGLLADAHARAGEPALALARLDEALQASGDGDGWWNAELHRMRGDVLARLDDAENARAAYNMSLDISRAQQSPVFERRAQKSLADLSKVSHS
jgi:tetratricopeptide (TPR) repeat protein